MPKDYHRAKPPPPSPPSTPPIRRKPNRSCLGWLIGGMALGVASSSILAPRDNPDIETAPATQAERPAAQPTFVYEKILREAEVDISKAPPPPPPAPLPQPPQAVAVSAQSPNPGAAAQGVPTPNAPASGTYLVQVASFGRAADAERLKAQLAQMGIAASIQTATLPNGKTAYRVRAGAYASREQAQQVSELLRRHGQNPMLVPLR
ncbi:SPOR domain-containing protein [Caldichromatium japonicum]|uniref:SPOR domain-containing protein n=1 Tax=Caldichromatium japonicum TaxID=2699430 RepID=A0A6G7VEJ6_9GAMM|nr:SPOR domain-containing protein [Caldichromatium japonicum]QIK38330.1 SPOR domain-containing protein [Caldichromatium japonicum]